MIKYLYFSRKIIICIALVLSFFTYYSKAQAAKGYSVLEPTTKDTLVFRTLEDNEYYSDAINCFNPAEVTRRPEIITNLSKQSSCFDKYSIAGELRRKLSDTDSSLEKLNLYKNITDAGLNNILEIDNAIKSNSLSKYDKLNFFIIPKGQLTNAKIKKNINHQPQCKIDSLDNSKTPVQSTESKEIGFYIFTENTKEQVNKIKKDLTGFKKIIDESKNGEFNTITTIGLMLKANSIANDLTLSSIENFSLVNEQLPSINKTATFVSITISDSNTLNKKNPSGKILTINITYPKLDSDLNLIGQESIDLPSMYLETFEKEIFPKILNKIQNRAKEYENMVNSFSKNRSNLSTSISTIEKDLSCYNVDNNSNSIRSISENVTEELNNDSNINQFETQTLISLLGDMWNKTLLGAKSTLLSVSDTTKQLVTIKPSPTPTPGVYKIINTKTTDETSPTPTISQTPSPSYSPKPTPNIVYTPKPTPTSTYSPKPTTTVFSTPKPSPTPYYSPTPSSSPIVSPTPTIAPTPTPSSMPTTSPTPSSSPIVSPTPTIAPTPTPSPIPSPNISPTTSPTTNI